MEEEPQKDLVMYRKMSVKMNQRQKAKQGGSSQMRAPVPLPELVIENVNENDSDDEDDAFEYMTPDHPSSRDYVNSEIIDKMRISAAVDRESQLQVSDNTNDGDWDDYVEYYNIQRRASTNRIQLHEEPDQNDCVVLPDPPSPQDNNNVESENETKHKLDTMKRVISLHPPSPEDQYASTIPPLRRN